MINNVSQTHINKHTSKHDEETLFKNSWNVNCHFFFKSLLESVVTSLRFHPWQVYAPLAHSVAS